MTGAREAVVVVGDGRKDEALHRAAARNFVAWHTTSVRALGLPVGLGDLWWTCTTPRPSIYHTAISRRPPVDDDDASRGLTELRVHLRTPGGRYVSVCDSFATLPLDRIGLRPLAETEWCARPPGPVPPGPLPAGLQVTEVHTETDLADFEQTVVAGFVAPPLTAPLSVHGRGVLVDPGLRLFLGRGADGAPVAVSMVQLAAGVAGIYGVTTVPAARGRGYATELTRRALAVAAGRPAVLQPTPAARGIYGRLGFRVVGLTRHWA